MFSPFRYSWRISCSAPDSAVREKRRRNVIPCSYINNVSNWPPKTQKVMQEEGVPYLQTQFHPEDRDNRRNMRPPGSKTPQTHLSEFKFSYAITRHLHFISTVLYFLSGKADILERVQLVSVLGSSRGVRFENESRGLSQYLWLALSLLAFILLKNTPLIS